MSMPRVADVQSAEIRRRLFGTDEEVPPALHLAAGALSCQLEAGAIRCLSWQGTELIRGMAYLLRDTNWGTAPAEVRQLHVEQQPKAFRVSFELVLTLPEGELIASAKIAGNAQGKFTFDVRARNAVALRVNRCGFVLLHPADAAGAPLAVEHTDGRCEDTCFPAQISPGQPVFDIRRLRHEAGPALSVDCRLEAELPAGVPGRFEMEDQRNWSDASFKTYVGSLLDPWPYELPAGASLCQSIEIQVHDSRPTLPLDAARAGTHLPCLRLGPATGARMPAIGLGVPAGLGAIAVEERRAVAALRPGWLVAEVDLGASADETLAQRLQDIAGLASECKAQVQLDVLCPAGSTPADAARQLADACTRAAWAPESMRPCPTPYLHSYQPQGRWPDLPGLELYAKAFGQAFPACRIGGGMLTYFTELNRKRTPSTGLHFIGHTTCPIVHAADDESVMQTLQALPHVVRSVRALWPALAYRLGPVTMAMHRNPYGERPAANPLRVRLAMASDDPRHQGAFGAAWLAGYAATVAPAGLEILSLNHSHGASGPLLRSDQPGWQRGACVPAWNVQRALVIAQGAELLSIEGLPAGVAGIAWAHSGGAPRMLLANLRPQPRQLQLTGRWTACEPSGPGAPDAPIRSAPVDNVLALQPYQVFFLEA